jgi:hypothetical protein
VAGCFWLGRGDRNAGWADRSGGAEFRLPLLIGVFGFAALQAVILNKAMSLIVVLTALPARLFAIPFLEVIAPPPTPRRTGLSSWFWRFFGC